MEVNLFKKNEEQFKSTARSRGRATQSFQILPISRLALPPLHFFNCRYSQYTTYFPSLSPFYIFLAAMMFAQKNQKN